jgi:glycosyltransferase involved in cell wall biosynthesis
MTETKGQLLFISKHAKAASTRYRILQYRSLLEQLGWQVFYQGANQGFKSKLAMLWRARTVDLVIVQRKLLDPLTFRLLRFVARKLVFDYDDAIFLNSTGMVSKKRQRAFERITASADLAVAGNAYLQSFARSKASCVIPTTVVLSDYPTCQEIENSYQLKANNAELTLVWIGSRSTRKYLEQYRDVLEAIGKANEHVRLRIIADFDMEFKYLKTEAIRWSKATEQQHLLSADIGIAPMTDDPWTQGKCALKVIQYMACGLPVISSNVGANAQVIADQATGYLVETTEQWLEALSNLTAAKQRKALGRSGRARVESHYSAEAASQLLDKAFSELAGNTELTGNTTD